MTDLIDDQQLSQLLRTGEPEVFATEVFTTGYWYVRLCQAVLASEAGGGVLSAPFAALPREIREHAVRSLLELPTHIGLLSLRDLAPLIGQLRSRYQLNILGMEALAAAVHLARRSDVTVQLSARSPKLEAALDAEGVAFRIRS